MKKPPGIPIDATMLFTLNFAYDYKIFAQGSYDMEFMLQRLSVAYMNNSLHINIDKMEDVGINATA